MGRIYDKHFKTSDVTDELLQLYRALVVYSSWRRSDTVCVPASGKGLAERALQSCLMKLSARGPGSTSPVVVRAIPALDTLALEIGSRKPNGLGMQAWLAAWIAVKAADAHSSGDSCIQQCHGVRYHRLTPRRATPFRTPQIPLSWTDYSDAVSPTSHL